MAMPDLQIHQLTYQYSSSPTPILRDLSLHLAQGWTGVVGANGCGKSTLLRLVCGELRPDSGMVRAPASRLYCPQRTDFPPEGLSSWLDADDAEAHRLRGVLGVESDWPDRWDTLSHGERKRCQMGAALYRAPDLLAVDEPTNHLDAEARARVLSALRLYRGVGLLVSHDRALLDALCGGCLFFEPGEVVLRPGGFSQGMAEAQKESVAAQRAYQTQKEEVRRLTREMRQRQKAAQSAAKKGSKRGLAPKDRDARAKIDLGRLTGKDASANRLYKQMKGRVQDAEKRLSDLTLPQSHATGIWIEGEPLRRPILLALPEGAIGLGSARLSHPALTLRPGDRIGLTGVNGSGKSTLVRALVQSWPHRADRLLYLPQEIDAAASAALLRDVQALPGPQLGHLMAVVRRLGSDPQALLESVLPSPGEVRKLMLALGITRSPALIIMDEPTNHMDLPSITALESALAQCPCALLLVSHDPAFLERLVTGRWVIQEEGRRYTLMTDQTG